ncbi:hypothetical protein RU98_GL001820 [Enterococcus caccae]|nr:hypothetical protein RU98_GL001820 [Enterococcus caccae]
MYEENELVKVEGPFQTKAVAEEYTKEFLKHWMEYFTKQGLNLVAITKCDENDEWYVEIIVQSIQ